MQPFACSSPSKPFRPQGLSPRSIGSRSSQMVTPASGRGIPLRAPHRLDTVARVSMECCLCVRKISCRRDVRGDGGPGPRHRSRLDPQPPGGVRQPDAQRPLDLPVEGTGLRRRGIPAPHQDARQGVRGRARDDQKLNTYELPEVLAYRVDDCSPAFASWIEKATQHPKKQARGKKPVARGRPEALSVPRHLGRALPPTTDHLRPLLMIAFGVPLSRPDRRGPARGRSRRKACRRRAFRARREGRRTRQKPPWTVSGGFRRGADAARARGPRPRRGGQGDRRGTAVRQPAASAGRGGGPARAGREGPAGRGAVFGAEPGRRTAGAREGDV